MLQSPGFTTGGVSASSSGRVFSTPPFFARLGFADFFFFSVFIFEKKADKKHSKGKKKLDFLKNSSQDIALNIGLN